MNSSKQISPLLLYLPTKAIMTVAYKQTSASLHNARREHQLTCQTRLMKNVVIIRHPNSNCEQVHMFRSIKGTIAQLRVSKASDTYVLAYSWATAAAVLPLPLPPSIP